MFVTNSKDRFNEKQPCVDTVSISNIRDFAHFKCDLFKNPATFVIFLWLYMLVIVLIFVNILIAIFRNVLTTIYEI